MKRYVAAAMKASFGPSGVDRYRKTLRKLKAAVRKLARRKWKQDRERRALERVEARSKAAKQLELTP